MNSAIDLESWVGGLNLRDRGLLEMTMAGHELARAAHALDLTLPPRLVQAATARYGLGQPNGCRIRAES